MSYLPSSAFYNTPIGQDGLGLFVERSIPKSIFDKEWTITSNYQHRPDLLAFDLYGDSNLWWVIVLRNKDVIEDPLNDFRAGVSIYLPPVDVIKKALGV